MVLHGEDARFYAPVWLVNSITDLSIVRVVAAYVPCVCSTSCHALPTVCVVGACNLNASADVSSAGNTRLLSEFLCERGVALHLRYLLIDCFIEGSR